MIFLTKKGYIQNVSEAFGRSKTIRKKIKYKTDSEIEKTQLVAKFIKTRTRQPRQSDCAKKLIDC